MNATSRLLLIAASTATALSLSAQPTSKTAAGGPAPGADARGKSVYARHCAACHGENGDGNGPATVWLFPKPRNFNAGLFKIQSTPAGSLPSDEDLFETITRGMPGSSMPSFGYLTEQERRDVVEYVKALTSDPADQGAGKNKFEAAKARGELLPPVAVPPEPGVTVEALVKGKEAYVRLQCFTCHGENGQGDGPSAPTLRDNWGLPLPPRDFTIGAFRGGSRGKDLYLRIANGMAGTPMPPFDDTAANPNEKWALVQFIQSVRRNEAEVRDILTTDDTRIEAKRVGAVFNDPTDTRWERLDTSVRAPLNPLWPEPYPVEAVAVTAIHDGKRLAVLCQWRDAKASGAPIRAQDFQDGMALQFSMSAAAPFLGMGDRENPVNLWYWRAGWQQEVDGGRPDMKTLFASMHVDTYFQPERQFATATSAGNILAMPHPQSPMEDANARGFGTLKPQLPKGQNVFGRGIWRDGFWNVVFIRDLASPDAEDVRFTVNQAVPVSFAVWNGEQRDRNGRKVISNWYQLVLEP